MEYFAPCCKSPVSSNFDNGGFLHYHLPSLAPFTVSKQINDKERVAAAMENPNLLSTVRRCIRDPE